MDSDQYPLKTIEDAVVQIQRDFPQGFLNAIKSLTSDDVKRYQSTLDASIKNALTSWLHNNTIILEHCGSYSLEEILGFVIWQLWQELRTVRNLQDHLGVD